MKKLKLEATNLIIAILALFFYYYLYIIIYYEYRMQFIVAFFVKFEYLNVISAWFVIIFGFLGMSMTLILGLPQAIHLYKCKKTGNVKYYSYWMFLFGIPLPMDIFRCFWSSSKNVCYCNI
nr:PQ-loop domain-containing transporter [Mycoplasmopsis bovis]